MNQSQNFLLTNEQIYEAEEKIISMGLSGLELMERAGAAVSDIIRTNFKKSEVVILCGPGNNGGDGFVVARLLKSAGWNVRVGCLVEKDKLTGYAKINANYWEGEIELISKELIKNSLIIVDAIFGSGLKRKIDQKLISIFKFIENSSAEIIAIDIPSGIHGNTGEVLGYALYAKICVTFTSKKMVMLLIQVIYILEKL